MLPFSDWANLPQVINQINRKVDALMSGLADLQSAEAQESADINTLVGVVNAFVTDLKAALANTDADAAVEAASAIVAAQDAQLKQITAQLQAADPGAPTAPVTPPAAS